MNNLARTWSTALIFTTPWIDDLQKFLREKAWIVVQVQKYGKAEGKYPQSIAWIYKRVIKLINGEFKGVYEEKYYDIFRREMPNDLYEEYIKRRDGVMKKDPPKDLKPKKTKPDLRVPTLEEVWKTLNAVRDNYALYTFYRLLLESGGREREALKVLSNYSILFFLA